MLRRNCVEVVNYMVSSGEIELGLKVILSSDAY